MCVEHIDHVQLPFSGPLQAQLRHFYGQPPGRWRRSADDPAGNTVERLESAHEPGEHP